MTSENIFSRKWPETWWYLTIKICITCMGQPLEDKKNSYFLEKLIIWEHISGILLHTLLMFPAAKFGTQLSNGSMKNHKMKICPSKNTLRESCTDLYIFLRQYHVIDGSAYKRRKRRVKPVPPLSSNQIHLYFNVAAPNLKVRACRCSGTVFDKNC